MAHWVAELMEQAEAAETPDARREAQARCAEAIQTLWLRRQHWPYGAPLQRVASALSALTGTPERFELERPEAEAGWGGAMAVVDRLGDEEWEVVRQAAIAELDMSEEKTLLEESPDDLDDEEREVIETVVELQEHQRGSYFRLGTVRVDGFGDLGPEEKARRVQEALADIERRRSEALAQAVATSPLGLPREGSDTPEKD